MRRAGRIAVWVLGVLLALPVVAVALVLIVANTAPGQRLIETQAQSLSGGMVRLAGLSGRFPDALRLSRLDVADANGVWLSAEGVALDWSPTALLGRRARIDRAVVDHLVVARAPVSAAPAKPAPPGQAPFQLPVSVSVRSLTVARADLGAALAGAAASLRIGGHADIASMQAGAATIDIARLDSAGTYHLDGVLSDRAITAHLRAAEPQGGLVGSLAKMPALGALAVDLRVDGPKNAERAQVNASAGELRITGHGAVDIPGKTQDLTLVVTAPAMRPRADLSWQSIDLHAHVTGSFTRPDAAAHVSVTQLVAGGAQLPSLAADIAGNQGNVTLHAVLTGARLPGPKPDLFSASPLDLTGDIRLDTPSRPVNFRLTHTLVAADGTAQTGGDITARLHVAVPDLTPLAAIGKVDLQGRTEAVATLAMHHGDSDIGVTGTADFTGGQAPVPALLGPTQFAVSAKLAGQDITIRDAQVNGRAIRADVTGTDRASGLDLAWRVVLTDLSRLSPQVLGALNASGKITGATSNLAVTADLSGEAGSPKFAKSPVTLNVQADHLPAAPQGQVRGAFRLAGAPVSLLADLSTDAAGLHLALKRADWKSLLARADLVLPKGQTIPIGNAAIELKQIGDAASLAGQDVTGSLALKLTSTAKEARIEAHGSNLAASGRRIAALDLTGAATGLETDPDIRAVLTLQGIDAQGITGAATVNAAGRQNALALRAHAGLQNLQGAPAVIDTAALLNAKAKQATLQTLTADWKTLALRLQGPARVDFGATTAVDHLRLSVNQAQIALAGQVAPALSVTASVRNVTPDLARAFRPDLQAAGLITADAHLTGTTAAPAGTVRLSATGLHLRTGPAASLPPASIAANVALNGAAARVEAHADAGPKLHMAANGTAPLSAGGALALRTNGVFDLTLLDPILQAGGRQARGRAALDLAVSGTAAAPRIAGAITLAHGEIQDFVQGAHLTNITARIDALGDSFRIAQFTADAAPGTIAVTGTVGALAPGLPVDLHVTARQARPLASDLLTAVFDADLAVQGHAAGEMRATGKLLLHRVEINVPDSFPPSVAVLNVRRPGDKPPPPPSAAAPQVAIVRLAIEVDAPRNIFVRGHGLDSELGGTLNVAGTSAAPLITGGFQMRRGDFSLAGTTLNFSKGDVSFNGVGVTGKIDPTLNFEADSTQGGITATLKVTGYADAPKIALSSVPDLPQDEVLAHLLFGTSMKQLSPLQIAEIGAALAELSGATGGGGGPLASIRKGLGLDRLNVGGGTNGAGATVEAGRYVANGVYVGAKQSAGGAGGTQAQVQVDLTRRLKLQTTLGTGGGTAQGATPDNDPGSSVGLSYQFEY